jgi:prephenate dehydratase
VTARRPTIAYQGEPGAFSELAILHAWNGAADPLPCAEFPAVIRAVQRGFAELGVLPVENSIAGRVDASVAAIAASALATVATIEHPIRLCLLAHYGTTIESLRTAESHPVALGQCGTFLRAHPWLEPQAAFDTAGAARSVAHARDGTRGAIASSRAAELHGLAILRMGIEDHGGNVTRFAVVARESTNVRSSALEPTGTGVKLRS